MFQSTECSTLDRIASIERAFCSNYSCCNLVLADLHELLEHFEEQHVTVAKAGAKSPKRGKGSPRTRPTPLQPLRVPTPPLTPGSTSSASSSSPTPSCSEPPSPTSSLFPVFPTIISPDDFDPYSLSLFSAPDGPRDLVDDLAVAPVHEATKPPVTVKPLLPALPIEQPRPTPPMPSVARPALVVRPPERPAATSHPVRREHAAQARVQAEPYTVPRKPASSKDSRRSGGRRRTSRVRAFKCPRPGCCKTYLNPNGLKYHLEKGTCKFEYDEGASESANGSGSEQSFEGSTGDYRGNAPPDSPDSTLESPSSIVDSVVSIERDFDIFA
ncbi:hypothetical protein HDZ31DRAFT_59854 [Schizophyllum fasciatum]